MRTIAPRRIRSRSLDGLLCELYGTVVLLSLIGNDSVVKAISGTLLGKKA